MWTGNVLVGWMRKRNPKRNEHELDGDVNSAHSKELWLESTLPRRQRCFEVCSVYILKGRYLTSLVGGGLVAKYCLTLAIPWTVTCQAPWASPSKNTGAGCHFLLQGIFLAQWLNTCLLHCRRILYCWVISSVQFSRSVKSDPLRPHESQHARPPCPSPTPELDRKSVV